MNTKKIFILLTLLVTVLFSACNADQEGEIYSGSGANDLSFSASNLGSFTLAPSAPTLSVVKHVVKEPFLTRRGITAVACSEGLFFIFRFGVLYLW